MTTSGARSSIIPYDPRPNVQVFELPEGLRAFNRFARFFLMRGENMYDPLWRYVRRVNRDKYRGQGASVRFGEYYLGLRGPFRIPAYVDFRTETLYVGKKLTIPFSSLRGVLVGHGVMPWRRVPVFVIMVKVDGCDSYLPIHQCLVDYSAVDLSDFLSSHFRVPMGIVSNPLHFLIPPGSARMIHSKGETPLYELRGMITSRGPDGRTRISILAGSRRIRIVDAEDPLGWIENWGIIADDLISIVTRRTRSRFGKPDW